MLRTAVVMALGLGALIGGPLAPAAQAETPRQVRLENHPVAARRHFESYPVRDGWSFVGPPGHTVVWRGANPPYLPTYNHLRQ